MFEEGHTTKKQKVTVLEYDDYQYKIFRISHIKQLIILLVEKPLGCDEEKHG